MVTIVTRAGKGSPLTNAELDANFVNLNNGLGVADLSITTAKLADLSVTTIKLADGAVTGPKMVAGAAAANLGYTPANRAGDTFTGAVTAPGLAVMLPGMLYMANAANAARFTWYLSGAEAAGNVGADLTLNTYDNAGAYIATPITVNRATGNITFSGTGTFAGNIGAVGGEMGFAGTPNVNTQLYFAKGPDAVFLYDHVSGYLDWYAAGAGTPVLRLVSPSGDLTIKGELTFGAGVWKAEPRGQYWARPAPGASFTLALSDLGACIVANAAAAIVVTIPPNSSVAWPNWARIDLIQYGAGQVTFAAGAGVTMHSAGNKLKTASQWSGVSIVNVNPNEWVLIGDLVA